MVTLYFTALYNKDVVLYCLGLLYLLRTFGPLLSTYKQKIQTKHDIERKRTVVILDNLLETGFWNVIERVFGEFYNVSRMNFIYELMFILKYI